MSSFSLVTCQISGPLWSTVKSTRVMSMVLPLISVPFMRNSRSTSTESASGTSNGTSESASSDTSGASSDGAAISSRSNLSVKPNISAVSLSGMPPRSGTPSLRSFRSLPGSRSTTISTRSPALSSTPSTSTGASRNPWSVATTWNGLPKDRWWKRIVAPLSTRRRTRRVVASKRGLVMPLTMTVEPTQPLSSSSWPSSVKFASVMITGMSSTP